MTLAPSDLVTIGTAIADRQARLSAPVIGRTEIAVLVGLEGGALDRWLKRHAVRPCSHGRYPARKVRTALALEAQSKRTA